MSPTIFHAVAEEVTRECLHVFCEGDAKKEFLIDMLFYSNDGMLAGENATELQHL
jgi:hypothetical protein